MGKTICMSSPPALTPVAVHQQRVRELLARGEPIDVPLGEATGLVLAADLLAKVALPGFDNSAMDGYALRYADVAAATAERPLLIDVSDDIPAGRTDVGPLAVGTAARIMTGAPMPPGADVVVPVEWTDAAQDGPPPTSVRIFQAPGEGQHVRREGEEASPGDVVLLVGTPITPPVLGLAAALGHDTLPVYPRPHVLVLSTGSELIAPGLPLRPGQIYESNSYMLVDAIRRSGCSAEALTMVPDDVEEFNAKLAAVAASADLVITSGGVSAGAYEVVKEAMTAAGTVLFDKVAMQPGMPQGCGTINGTPIITLPGNPVSVYVSFEVFVRPALRARLGFTETSRRRVSATWRGGAAGSPNGKRQFLRAHYDPTSNTVSPVGTPPSHLLASLARADSLTVVPAEVTAISDGDMLEVWLLDAAETATEAARG